MKIILLLIKLYQNFQLKIIIIFKYYGQFYDYLYIYRIDYLNHSKYRPKMILFQFILKLIIVFIFNIFSINKLSIRVDGAKKEEKELYLKSQKPSNNNTNNNNYETRKEDKYKEVRIKETTSVANGTNSASTSRSSSSSSTNSSSKYSLASTTTTTADEQQQHLASLSSSSVSKKIFVDQSMAPIRDQSTTTSKSNVLNQNGDTPIPIDSSLPPSSSLQLPQPQQQPPKFDDPFRIVKITNIPSRTQSNFNNIYLYYKDKSENLKLFFSLFLFNNMT